MKLVKAYLMPHPPLAVPSVGNGMEEKISGTVIAFNKVADEIAALAPECIIIVTPHAESYSHQFSISYGKGASGSFSLFGVPGIKLEAEYDKQMADEIKKNATGKGIDIGFYGTDNGMLDHGVMVPLWYVNKKYDGYKIVRIAVSGLDAIWHYRLGMAISEAVGGLKRKTVFIASGDLSHKLKKDGPYGFAAEGVEFDRQIRDIFTEGDFSRLLEMPGNFLHSAGECAYKGLVVLAGCFDGKKVDTEVLSYEGPFGVGYCLASASDSGEAAPKLSESYIQQDSKKTKSKNPYVNLAYMALEHAVLYTRELPVPSGLPKEMHTERAGVFVSLHKHGELRGCIGTIASTTNSVAEEIIRNALNAGLYDPRFSAVTKDELPHLSVKVDVLKEPEAISSVAELDVKRYGVIVSSGQKRGLLLPNLDGIDSVEMQFTIARQKAGIASGENVALERFEVVRHE